MITPEAEVDLPESYWSDQLSCWYASAARRPHMSRCPTSCNGAPSSAERLGDGVQRFYCEAHAHWRASEVGKQYLRPMRTAEPA